MNQRAEDAFRADIVEVGRRMYARGYVASNDGNISVRLDEATILTTPKSVSKGFMTADMMVVVDLDGKKIRGTRDASSELLMHLEVYRNRPDCTRGRSCASTDGDGVRSRRHPARPRRAGRSRDHARQHSDRRGTARRLLPSFRRPSASTSRLTTGCCSPTTAR